MSVVAGYEVHPAAELFPLMEGKEFAGLKDNIGRYGLREPVVLTPDGQLLDGRNRGLACEELGFKPDTRIEHSEPWAFAISANVHRRHLTPSQLAMVAARMAVRTNGQRSASSNEEGDLVPPSRDEVSQLLGIGHASIDRAREVLDKGTEDLQQAVDAGQIKVHTANRVVREFTPEQQDDFVRQVRDGADASKLAASLDVPNNFGTGGWKRKNDPQPVDEPVEEPVEEAWERDPRSIPKRGRYLTTDAIASLCGSLEAMELVMRSIEGLHPSVTREEAAQWLGDLSKSRGVVSRVTKLLNERKESSQ